MEHKFLSGVSVFDFLTMIVPGCLILAMGANFFGKIPLVIDMCEQCKFSGYIVIMVSSYLLGLINNSLMDFMFKWFRNNSFYIQIQYLRMCNALPNKSVLGQLNIPSDIIKIERLKSFRKYIMLLFYSLKTLIYKSKTDNFKSCEERKKILAGYYQAYYFVATNQINSSISIMECQVAFVRNLILLIFLMGVVCKTDVVRICFGVDVCRWIYIVVSLCLFVVMFTRQNKVYRRVFEDYVYLKSMK